MQIACMRLIESYIVISLHQLDSSPVYMNVSHLKVVAAEDRRHRGAGRSGVKSSQVGEKNRPTQKERDLIDRTYPKIQLC